VRACHASLVMRELVCGSLRMSSLEAVATRLSFDDILEAVQDSRRGRWFLSEFETRLRKQETQSILGAISRLETRMEGLSNSGGNTSELVKVRSAIANARNDLLKMGAGKEALSKEGRLFADLADMARKSLPEDENASIVRSLQLVDEIDKAIGTPESAKYFAADANLFERPAATKPVLVAQPEAAKPVEQPAIAKPAEAKKEEPVIATGAKLVIRKAGAPVETPKAEEAPEIEVAAAPSPAPTLKAESPVQRDVLPADSDAPAVDSPRIVIIRRKAEDMPEVADTAAA
jgi:hypothetical protein